MTRSIKQSIIQITRQSITQSIGQSLITDRYMKKTNHRFPASFWRQFRRKKSRRHSSDSRSHPPDQREISARFRRDFQQKLCPISRRPYTQRPIQRDFIERGWRQFLRHRRERELQRHLASGDVANADDSCAGITDWSRSTGLCFCICSARRQ